MHHRRVDGRRPLRVGDPVTGGHHVELTGPDRLHVAEAVPVQDLAVQQPGHRLQPGVRVRRHLHAGPLRHIVRAEMVDEAPRANHPARPLRQQPPHRGVPTQRHVVAGQQHAAGINVGHARWSGLRQHRFSTLHRPTVRSRPPTTAALPAGRVGFAGLALRLVARGLGLAQRLLAYRLAETQSRCWRPRPGPGTTARPSGPSPAYPTPHPRPPHPSGRRVPPPSRRRLPPGPAPESPRRPGCRAGWSHR